jgi:ubiquinone/menaquinone biosynthesis C-methylase UbiE
VATAFDDLAPDYDASFTYTALGLRLRELVSKRCDELFQPGQVILELGCGTGEDAARLARKGVRVVAIDPAERMLAIARTKATHADAEPVEFHCMPMEAAPRAFADRNFNGVFSNFGAVNCVGDLATLTRGLATLCTPGARLLWVVMGRHVPWEWAWYALRAQPCKAVRRLRPNGVDWRGLHIAYPTPRELSRALQPHFTVTRIAPLGCVLPPSYAGAWLERSPRTLAALSTLERALQRYRALATYADHFMIEATRATDNAAVSRTNIDPRT